MKQNYPLRQSHIERVRAKQKIEAIAMKKIRKHLAKIARIYMKALGPQDYYYLNMAVMKMEDGPEVMLMAHNDPNKNTKHIEINITDFILSE